jgi:putative flippase GtrA
MSNDLMPNNEEDFMSTKIEEMKNNNGGLMQLIKFGVVGFVSTIIDIGLLKVLSVIGWPLWLAVATGFLAGTVNGYFMNSRWTFGYKTAGREGAKFGQFTTIALIGLGLTEIIVNLYVNNGGEGMLLAGFNISSQMTGKIIAVAIVFFWNYFGNKMWTFKK